MAQLMKSVPARVHSTDQFLVERFLAEVAQPMRDNACFLNRYIQLPVFVRLICVSA